MGKVKSVGYGLLVLIFAEVVSRVQAACPAVGPGRWAALLGAGVISGVALYVAKPRENAGIKATALGIGTSIGTGLMLKLGSECPDLVTQLPSLIVAGVGAGYALWLRSPKEVEGQG